MKVCDGCLSGRVGVRGGGRWAGYGWHRSTIVTCRWTWTCGKITDSPIRTPVSHRRAYSGSLTYLATQQLALRNSRACGDLQKCGSLKTCLSACQPQPLSSQGCLIGKCLHSFPAINADTLYLLQKLWLF